MDVFAEIDACRAAVRAAQRAGASVGLVPTMGALHAGHVSLIEAARARCEIVAVTIFVNPTQFGPGEDYKAYPRVLDTDLEVCRTHGTDIVFAPAVDTMYPPGSLTTVRVSRITDVLCGPRRAGHFDGVTTVAAKLFGIIPADVAFFGEKDYQQLVVLRQMAHDLNMPIQVVGCPTVREPDGLALSSRNAYLSPGERAQAVSLSRGLFGAVEQIEKGRRDVTEIVEGIRRTILDAGPAEIEYIDVVDAATLGAPSVVDRPVRICLAVRIGSCRLIDNVGVDVSPKVG